MKHHDTAPSSSLIFRDVSALADTELRVTPSNEGEPYRETLLLSYERRVQGTGTNLHIATVELDASEEAQLRAMLNARAARRLRRFAGVPHDPAQAFVIWDLDRVFIRDVSAADCYERLAEASQRQPASTVHLLGSLATAQAGTVKAFGPAPSAVVSEPAA